MKISSIITVISGILIFTASCKSKAQKEAEDYMSKVEKTMKENTPSKTDDQQKPNKELAPLPADMGNIIGEWDLVKVVRDDNGNYKLDAEDSENIHANKEDYLKLNANGTCEMYTIKTPGYWEIITNDGRKQLMLYFTTGEEASGASLYVNSATDKELVINRVAGGADFQVFKRR